MFRLASEDIFFGFVRETKHFLVSTEHFLVLTERFFIKHQIKIIYSKNPIFVIYNKKIRIKPTKYHIPIINKDVVYTHPWKDMSYLL